MVGAAKVSSKSGKKQVRQNISRKRSRCLSIAALVVVVNRGHQGLVHSENIMSEERVTAREAGDQDDSNQVLSMLDTLRQRGGIIGSLANMLAPGVGPGVILFICSALVLLIALCGVAVLAGYYSFHMFNLIVLAVGLMGSVVWSYSIRRDIQKQHEQQQVEEDNSDSEGDDDENEGEATEENVSETLPRSRRGKSDAAKKDD